MSITGELHIRYFMFFLFGDLIDNGLACFFCFQLRVNFYIEVALTLEVRYKRLFAFLHGFFVNADSLICR